MSDVRACARALVQRVAEGGEIPMASLRELAELVQRSELVAVSQQLLDGPPEFALRRARDFWATWFEATEEAGSEYYARGCAWVE